MFLQAFAALTFQNAERNLSPKNSSHPQVPMIMPSFVRRMVPIWDPCPKLHGNHAAALEATPNGSVPKWSLNASQRHENLWPLGNRNKYGGKHRENRLMNWESIEILYTKYHPEIDSWQSFLLGCFWTYVFCWWVWVLFKFKKKIKLWCSFCNLTGQSQGFFFKHIDRQGSEGGRSRSQGEKVSENARKCRVFP